LIKHESDFKIAKDEKLQLIPEKVDWEQFCDFTASFEHINDLEVSARYRFGELRLICLNFYAELFLRRFHYQRTYSQYGAYFARFYGPFLFIYGILSVFLGSMQVVLAAEQLSSLNWISLWRFCRWFSVVSLIGMGALILCLPMLLVLMIVNEWRFALKDRFQKPQGGKPGSMGTEREGSA